MDIASCFVLLTKEVRRKRASSNEIFGVNDDPAFKHEGVAAVGVSESAANAFAAKNSAKQFKLFTYRIGGSRAVGM